MMTDELLRSMKAQMEPSDDVVADLLAKIAAEASSPVTENENVVPFRQPAEEEIAAGSAALPKLEISSRKGTLKQKKKNSIWYYGTAICACIIFFVSTFALLHSAGDPDNPSTVQDLLGQVVGSDSQINTDNDGEEGKSPADTLDGEEQTDSDEEAGDDAQVSEEEEGKGATSGDEKQKGEKESNGAGSQSGSFGDTTDNTASDSQNGGSATGSGTEGGNGSNGGNGSSGSNGGSSNGGSGSGSSNAGSGSGSQSGSSGSEDASKVTPGAPGTDDIAWTNEIISSSAVASINISGTNYVVESTVSASDLSGTIETVTIDLPSTSSTNQTTVTAKVKALKNVSSAAMVALDVEGFDQPLVYTNPDYSPSTLGELVSDLSLEGNISYTDSVRCQISRVGYSSNRTYRKELRSAVWKYLLSNSDAQRGSYSSFNSGNEKLLFVSNSNPTGSQIQFGLSDNGYLYVSMAGGKKFTFQVGTNQAQEFIQYVTGE